MLVKNTMSEEPSNLRPAIAASPGTLRKNAWDNI